MADNFSPWVGANNKLQAPKGVNPEWNKRLTPQQQAMAWGSFAGDDPPPPAQPTTLGHYQGQGTMVTAVLPPKPPQNPLLSVDIPAKAAPRKQPPAAPPRLSNSQAPITQSSPTPGDNNADDGSYPVPDDSDFQATLANLDEAHISGIQDQKRGLADQEADLAALKAKSPKVDLSPLLAYNDSLYGTNLSKGYRAPQNQDDLDKQAQGLQELIQKNRQGLSKDQINILDSALSSQAHVLGIDDASMTRKAISDQNIALRQSLGEDGLDVKKRGQDMTAAGKAAALAQKGAKGSGDDVHKYQTDYMRDPQVKKSTATLAIANTAYGILEEAHNGNEEARSAAALKLANLTIPTRINNAEIDRLTGVTNALGKFEQIKKDIIGSNGKGGLTDQNYNFMKRYVDVVMKSEKDAINDRLRFHGGNYARKSGKSLDESMQSVGSSDYTKYYTPDAKPGGTGKTAPKVMSAKDLP